MDGGNRPSPSKKLKLGSGAAKTLEAEVNFGKNKEVIWPVVKPRSSCPSMVQKNMLYDFMQEHGFLMDGKNPVICKFRRKELLLNKAKELNAIPGARKSPEKWLKAWGDMKRQIYIKISSALKQNGTPYLKEIAKRVPPFEKKVFNLTMPGTFEVDFAADKCSDDNNDSSMMNFTWDSNDADNVNPKIEQVILDSPFDSIDEESNAAEESENANSNQGLRGVRKGEATVTKDSYREEKLNLMRTEQERRREYEQEKLSIAQMNLKVHQQILQTLIELKDNMHNSNS